MQSLQIFLTFVSERIDNLITKLNEVGCLALRIIISINYNVKHCFTVGCCPEVVKSSISEREHEINLYRMLFFFSRVF